MRQVIFKKTVGEYFRTSLVWGISLSLLMSYAVIAFNDILNSPDRAKLLADGYKLATSGAVPGGRAYDLDTFGGFLTFRFLSFIPIILGVFTLLAGSAITRGEEEKGSLDLLISTPHSRRMVLLQKWAALLVVVLIIVTVMGPFIWLGAFILKVELDLGMLALTLLNILLVGMVFGTLAMLCAQLWGTRKAAASWTGGVLAATFEMESLAGQVSGLNWLHYFTPFHYYNISKPLARSLGPNWGAMAMLAGISMVILGVATYLYERRDQGNVFQLLKTTKAKVSANPYRVAKSRTLWLANNFTFGLRAALPGSLAWSLLPTAYLGIILGSLDNLRNEISNVLKSDLYRSQGFSALPTNENVLSVPVGLVLLMASIYAVTQVAGWAGEETHGRMELMLSLPHPRWSLLLNRVAVTIVCQAVMVGSIGVGFALVALANQVALDPGKTFSAFFAAWLISLSIVALGFLVVAFSPTRTVTVLGSLVTISYLLDMLGSLLNLPGWITGLSVFRQYGRPLLNGLDWTVLLVILSLSLLFFSIAIFRFRNRDILRGA